MLAATVDEAAQRFGDAAAYLSADGWSLSFEQLRQLSQEVAATLIRSGIGEGDVVALVLPSIPEYVVAYIAASRVGAITAGVNARLTETERAAVLATADPALVIATDDLMPDDHVVPGARRHTLTPATAAVDVLTGLREPGASVVALPDDPDRPIAIVFTSGTTGTPRGAVFSARQLDFITRVDTGNRWGGAGASLAGTSFAHLGPMTKLPGNLRRGGMTVLMDRWTARSALELIAHHRMAGIGGIPTQIALMLREPAFDTFDLSSVQAIVIGGGPATPHLVREARQKFGASLAVRYSCTEAGIGVGTAFDAAPEDAETSVGRPHPGVSVSIIGPTGEPMPDGEIGEVCLRSPAVMNGYWRDARGTAEAFTIDGSVRTGDLGFLDEASRLCLAGRTKEMYVRGGYNVYPAEVEAVLADHPSVLDVAVVARPDEVMGEIGVAVVVPRDGDDPPTLDDLRSFGTDRVAGHKLPEAVLVLPALPLTAMEKVDRARLTTMVADVPTPRS